MVGLIEMSGRETTAKEPRERGCSGSEMVEIRSKISCSSMGSTMESESLPESTLELDAGEKGSSE